MKLAAIHTSPPAPSGTASAALAAHRNEVNELAAEDATWASKESAAREEVRKCGAAQAHLAQLEERLIDAKADVAAVGHTATNIAALTKEIETAKVDAEALIQAGRMAQSMLTRHISPKRGTLRDQRLKLAAQTRPLRHAAMCERLADALDVLVAAEQSYVRSLERAFGIAAAVDELAREAGPALPFAGYLNLPELLLQRPSHPSFVDSPFITREAIAANIVAVAEQTAKEL